MQAPQFFNERGRARNSAALFFMMKCTKNQTVKIPTTADQKGDKKNPNATVESEQKTKHTNLKSIL